MFVLRARHTQIDKLSAHGFKLGARLGHIHARGHTAGQPPLRQIELMLEVPDRRR